jgi:hypothetical protein
MKTRKPHPKEERKADHKNRISEQLEQQHQPYICLRTFNSNMYDIHH